MQQNTFFKGQLVIYDSGKSYELGEFVCDSSEQINNTFKVNLISGNVLGISLFNKSTIKLFSHALEKRLKDKYLEFVI